MKEIQRISLWICLVLAIIISIAFFLGQQGNKPGEPWVILVVWILIMSFLLSMKLESRADANKLEYRLFPFQIRFRAIPFSEISHWEVRKYKPLAEFGGWGLRINRRGVTAFTIRGNYGIEVHTSAGKKILLGTASPEKWKKFLENRLGSAAQ